MAQNFTRYTQQDITNVAEYLPSAPVAASTQFVVSGLIVCNKETNPVFVSVSLVDGSTVETFLVKDAEISAGESLVTIGWDQKLVMTTGDRVKVVTNNASHKVDAILSVLEITA